MFVDDTGELRRFTVLPDGLRLRDSMVPTLNTGARLAMTLGQFRPEGYGSHAAGLRQLALFDGRCSRCASVDLSGSGSMPT
jgi:hypothetical protein